MLIKLDINRGLFLYQSSDWEEKEVIADSSEILWDGFKIYPSFHGSLHWNYVDAAEIEFKNPEDKENLRKLAMIRSII